LVACSGGADSAALAISLAQVKPQVITLGYIAHDLRNADVVEHEREVVRKVARELGCGFVTQGVLVREQKGNIEAAARRLRYAALRELALQEKCLFVASGHQATDQLETVLMRLLRGTGSRGLRGVAERRSLGDGVMLIRPMLGVTREEAEGVCEGFGYVPLMDSTNADVSLLRNAIRAKVIPVLKELRPGVERRVAVASMLQADGAELIDAAVASAAERCGEVAEDGRVLWNRRLMKRESVAAVRGLVWKRARELAIRVDRVDHAAIRQVVEVIMGQEMHRKEWHTGGVRVVVNSKSVTCERMNRPQ
jgi:tRNA(Ile)-lysidine synthase